MDEIGLTDEIILTELLCVPLYAMFSYEFCACMHKYILHLFCTGPLLDPKSTSLAINSDSLQFTGFNKVCRNFLIFSYVSL